MAHSTTFTVTSTLNGCTSTAYVTVVVLPRPLVSASVPSVICSGEPFIVNFRKSQGATVSWSRTNANIDGNTSVNNVNSIYQFFYNYSGTNQNMVFTLTASIGNCTQSTSYNVTVRPALFRNVTAVDTVCTSGIIPFTFTNYAAGTTIRWYRDSTITGIGGPASGTASTNFNVILTNGDSVQHAIAFVITGTFNGCSQTSYVTVVVKPKPILSATVPTVVCSGEPFILNFRKSPGSMVSWSRTNTNIDGNMSVNDVNSIYQFFYNYSGVNQTMTFTLSGSNSGCTQSTNYSVIVRPAPYRSVSGPDTVCSGSAISFAFTNFAVGTIVNWTRDGSDPKITGPTSGSARGNFPVTLRNTDTINKTVTFVLNSSISGCSVSSYVTVIIRPAYQCGGTRMLMNEDSDGNLVNIDEKLPLSVRAYPNPFAGNIHVEVSNPRNDLISIRIFDVSGKLMWETRNTQQSFDINAEGLLSKGIYLVEVTKGEQRRTLKVIKAE